MSYPAQSVEFLIKSKDGKTPLIEFAAVNCRSTCGIRMLLTKDDCYRMFQAIHFTADLMKLQTEQTKMQFNLDCKLSLWILQSKSVEIFTESLSQKFAASVRLF